MGATLAFSFSSVAARRFAKVESVATSTPGVGSSVLLLLRLLCKWYGGFIVMRKFGTMNVSFAQSAAETWANDVLPRYPYVISLWKSCTAVKVIYLVTVVSASTLTKRKTKTTFRINKRLFT